MNEWKKIAIRRIEKAIEDVCNLGTSPTTSCPVCTHMKIWLNIRPTFLHSYPCISPINVKCPAWSSCKRFLDILKSCESKMICRPTAIKQLEELIDSLK